MDRSDAECVVRTLEGFTAGGLGDVKALKVALKDRIGCAWARLPIRSVPGAAACPDQVGFASIAQAGPSGEYDRRTWMNCESP
jgi:hypothetical protein